MNIKLFGQGLCLPVSLQSTQYTASITNVNTTNNIIQFGAQRSVSLEKGPQSLFPCGAVGWHHLIKIQMSLESVEIMQHTGSGDTEFSSDPLQKMPSLPLMSRRNLSASEHCCHLLPYISDVCTFFGARRGISALVIHPPVNIGFLLAGTF